MGEEISQPYFQIQHSNDIEALNVNINLLNEQFYKEVSATYSLPPKTIFFESSAQT